MKVHEFHKSLSKGKQAEVKFLSLFPDLLLQTDGKTVDFTVVKDGSTLELKTDFYDPKTTSNLFLERFSYDMKPGGAHQALEKGATYFVYWFIVTGEIFAFKTADLVKRLDECTKGMYLCSVRNKGHTSQGYKIPRKMLEDLRLKMEDIL